MTEQIIIQGKTTEEFYADLKSAVAEVLQEFKGNTTDQDYLTREEVCELLNINLTTLWKHTKSSRLKKYNLGRKVYYKKQEVLDAVKSISLKKDLKLSVKETSKILNVPIPRLKFHLRKGNIIAQFENGNYYFNKEQLNTAQKFINTKI